MKGAVAVKRSAPCLKSDDEEEEEDRKEHQQRGGARDRRGCWESGRQLPGSDNRGCILIFPAQKAGKNLRCCSLTTQTGAPTPQTRNKAPSSAQDIQHLPSSCRNTQNRVHFIKHPHSVRLRLHETCRDPENHMCSLLLFYCLKPDDIILIY
ncbi:Hypothetical predicted protein [Xyrichtys novacula]|uniref:Uncharacterized protein n=1 Tax=Xyrichtys novacula TaxID=13765 RepID=A0AAV1FV00_XYRNO|nr:Hypothetical predicted protein [Xyrichtys novacula]